MDIYCTDDLKKYLENLFEKMGLDNYSFEEIEEEHYSVSIILTYNDKKLILDEFNQIKTIDNDNQ